MNLFLLKYFCDTYMKGIIPIKDKKNKPYVGHESPRRTPPIKEIKRELRKFK